MASQLQQGSVEPMMTCSRTTLPIVTALLAMNALASGGGKAGNAAWEKISPELRTSVANAAASDEPADVIVEYEEEYWERARSNGGEGERAAAGQLEHLPFGAMRVRLADLETLASHPGVKYISPDRDVSAMHFPPWMLKEAIGYRFAAMTVPERPVEKGKGVGIAIVDSGIAADDYLKSHASGCLTSRVVYHENFVAGETTTGDVYGHGTHVAGIAGGDGRCLTGQYVDFSGIAPEAQLVNLRVLDSRGMGKDSAVIAAIDRAIALKSTYKIRVINLSLGRTIRESFTKDPLCLAVEKAWKAGITVVVAAGNNGRDNSMETLGYSTITSPANDPFVISVGATRMVGHTGREDDTVTSYSSKGPSLLDQVVKPDLVAPGNIVYARMNPGAYLVQSYQTNMVLVSMGMGPTIRDVFLLSGTSMAAPVVAGSAALLLEKDPTLKPDQIKARLMKTAWKNFTAGATITDPTTGETFLVDHNLFTVGAGHLDLKAALASTEKSPSSRRALSPRVVRKDGKVTLTTTYPSLSSTGVVWGSSTTWGTGVVWGTQVLASGTNTVTGSGVVWGTGSPTGFGVCWGTGVVWGETNPFDEALSIRGDR